MAKIVYIEKGTYRKGINEIGDIVTIHDDDAKLSGAGYKNFGILEVPGYTAEQVKKIIEAKIPERNIAFYSSVGEKWTFERPQEKQVWKNEKGLWCFIEKEPKYHLTISALAAEDMDILSSKLTTSTQKEAALRKVQAKIPLDNSNSVEATDLNA